MKDQPSYRAVLLIFRMVWAAMLVAAWVGKDPLAIAQTTFSWQVATGVLLHAIAWQLPLVWVGWLMTHRYPRGGILVGSMGVAVLPMVTLLNAMTVRWMGERLFSYATWRVLTEFREGLLNSFSVNAFLGFVLPIGLTFGAVFLGVYASHRVASWVTNWGETKLSGIQWQKCFLVFSLIVPACCVLNPRRDLFGAPSLTQRLIGEATTNRESPVFDWQSFDFASAIAVREQRQRFLSIDDQNLPNELPDVLIVVIESFRHELIDDRVMPNLWAHSQRGLFCRSHFSGGNATNHGLFSLVNGLEAIWHSQPVRYTPLLNRLFHQADYEQGFFGGHDDWRTFYMDGYVSPNHYDHFEIEPPDGLASDRRAIERTKAFFERSDQSSKAMRKPRLAVLYLYATHATYWSDPQDRSFQPAASDHFPLPYGASLRDQVWNRYRNSARTIDRLLKPLLVDDRVWVVTGDHGESFLEDETIGHGVRLSRYQNMTPAVLFAPQHSHREIREPTMHADLLPTLLASAGLNFYDRGKTGDGMNLWSASDDELRERCFVTRDYLKEEVAIIGPWTNQPGLPFAHKAVVSLKDPDAVPLHAIDQKGDPWLGDFTDHPLQRWLQQSFSADP